MRVTERRQLLLGQVAMAGFACFIVATLMAVIGDPFWNLYVIWFGWFIALPVAVIAFVWRSVRRGHVLRLKA